MPLTSNLFLTITFHCLETKVSPLSHFFSWTSSNSFCLALVLYSCSLQDIELIPPNKDSPFFFLLLLLLFNHGIKLALGMSTHNLQIENTGLERFKPFASVYLVKLSFSVSSLWFRISVPLPPQPFVSFLCCCGFDPCSWIPTWRLVYGHLSVNVHLWLTTTSMSLRLLDVPGFLCISSNDPRGPDPTLSSITSLGRWMCQKNTSCLLLKWAVESFVTLAFLDWKSFITGHSRVRSYSNKSHFNTMIKNSLGSGLQRWLSN